MTQESLTALANLRVMNSFEWYLIPFLAYVVYVYAKEVEKAEWDKILVAIGYYAAEFVLEIVNAIILKISNYSALWTTPGKTGYLIYVGLNIEISLMFSVAPIVLFSLLPKDKSKKILEINNRVLIPFIFGLFCVCVECLLNKWGALAWAYSWWSFPHVWLIMVSYCGSFALITWVYDNVSLNNKKILALIAIFTGIISHVAFATMLKWV